MFKRNQFSLLVFLVTKYVFSCTRILWDSNTNGKKNARQRVVKRRNPFIKPFITFFLTKGRKSIVMKICRDKASINIWEINYLVAFKNFSSKRIKRCASLYLLSKIIITIESFESLQNCDTSIQFLWQILYWLFRPFR